LSIALAGNNAQLSWPLFAQDYVLQQKDLSGLSSWTTTAGTYFTNASSVTVMTQSTVGQRLFRLQR
jgi:hypothetical protein